jgi:hypothetical protein
MQPMLLPKPLYLAAATSIFMTATIRRGNTSASSQLAIKALLSIQSSFFFFNSQIRCFLLPLSEIISHAKPSQKPCLDPPFSSSPS